MRPKRKNVCQDCRSKKLACDGAQPACSQCTLRRIACSGYKQEFVFVPNKVAPKPSSQARLAQKKKASPPADLAPFFESLRLGFHQPSRNDLPVDVTNAAAVINKDILEKFKSHSVEENIAFIMGRYGSADNKATGKPSASHNPICGAWVDVLPFTASTRRRDEPLVSAIEVLATALKGFDGTDSPHQPNVLDLYCESLRKMGKALTAAKGVFHIEHCAAIMCLAVTDIMSPELKSGWTTHARGVGDMMETLGPAYFNAGAMHTIFVGFRPLLLTSSILNQRGTFLAREEWTSTPFVGQPMSIMQQLINRVCALPALLETYHQINDLSNASNLPIVQRLLHDFSELLASLRQWARKSQSEASHPLVWARSEPELCLFSSGSALWFPNMMTANSMTHYWAFEIIIRTHLSILHQAIVTATKDDQRNDTQLGTKVFEEQSLLKLADMICDSTSYLLQPEMKLHGLWSAFFTLPTALRVFRHEQDLTSSQAERLQEITKLLASRGIRFQTD